MTVGCISIWSKLRIKLTLAMLYFTILDLSFVLLWCTLSSLITLIFAVKDYLKSQHVIFQKCRLVWKPVLFVVKIHNPATCVSLLVWRWKAQDNLQQSWNLPVCPFPCLSSLSPFSPLAMTSAWAARRAGDLNGFISSIPTFSSINHKALFFLISGRDLLGFWMCISHSSWSTNQWMVWKTNRLCGICADKDETWRGFIFQSRISSLISKIMLFK